MHGKYNWWYNPLLHALKAAHHAPGPKKETPYKLENAAIQMGGVPVCGYRQNMEPPLRSLLQQLSVLGARPRVSPPTVGCRESAISTVGGPLSYFR